MVKLPLQWSNQVIGWKVKRAKGNLIFSVSKTKIVIKEMNKVSGEGTRDSGV